MHEAYNSSAASRHPARRPPSTILFDQATLLDRTAGTAPYEGVREMVAALAAAGYRLGLVGEMPMVGASFPLELFEVRVAEGLEALPVPVDEAAYVSGSPASLAAGRAAGMAIGAALWASIGREGLTELAPEWAFEVPADVTRAFVSWC